MNLIIDVGNTRVKLAVFEQDRLIHLAFSTTESFLKKIDEVVKNYPIQATILSSVSAFSEDKFKKIVKHVNFLELSSNTKVPFVNLYGTPQTLGVDRIALITAAVIKYPNKNVLVIDAGTCITFDFVTNKGEYLGGAISPGIEMRYKALHQFTTKLPLLTPALTQSIVGANTNESINSGVLNGVFKEIDGIILEYKNKFIDLTVVLTGGDSIFLSKQLKSSIFATQNFLLEGLNEILNYNITE